MNVGMDVYVDTMVMPMSVWMGIQGGSWVSVLVERVDAAAGEPPRDTVLFQGGNPLQLYVVCVRNKVRTHTRT